MAKTTNGKTGGSKTAATGNPTGDGAAFANRPENIGKADVKRPQNGAEYLESLRDGRTVFIYGERVDDVTTHPAFRNTARMVARLYDALHAPAHKDVLTTETDAGSGGYTHRFFRVPSNAEEQVAARDEIADWARLTYGF